MLWGWQVARVSLIAKPVDPPTAAWEEELRITSHFPCAFTHYLLAAPKTRSSSPCILTSSSAKHSSCRLSHCIREIMGSSFPALACLHWYSSWAPGNCAGLKENNHRVPLCSPDWSTVNAIRLVIQHYTSILPLTRSHPSWVPQPSQTPNEPRTSILQFNCLNINWNIF